MKQIIVFLSIMAVVATGCSDSNSAPTSNASSNPEQCELPPEPEQELPDSDFVLTISPNPVGPGTEADLTIETIDESDDDLATGAGALFQCWDGSSWIDIAQLLKNGFGPNNEPAAIDLGPDVTVTIPAVAILIADQPFTILIPNVPSGIYRIEDSVIVGSSQQPVYGLIEVEIT